MGISYDCVVGNHAQCENFEDSCDCHHHLNKVVAVVYNPETNEKHDECWSWEAGQNYARGNYKVVAVAADGHMTINDAQELYDYERRIAQDCYGLSDTQVMEEW